MTDRVNALIVTLEEDVRDDDAEWITKVMMTIKGVLSVETNVADIGAHVAKQRAKAFYRSKLLQVMEED